MLIPKKKQTKILLRVHTYFLHYTSLVISITNYTHTCIHTHEHSVIQKKCFTSRHFLHVDIHNSYNMILGIEKLVMKYVAVGLHEI